MKQQQDQNKLDAPWLEQMRQEMSDCTDFGTTLPADGWDKIAAKLGAPSIAPEPEEKSHRKGIILWFSAAASFLLLLGLGLTLMMQTNEADEQSTLDNTSTVVAQADTEHIETIPTEPESVETISTKPEPVVDRPTAEKALPVKEIIKKVNTSSHLAMADTNTKPSPATDTPQKEEEVQQSAEPVADEAPVPTEKETQKAIESFESQLKQAETEVLMAMNDTKGKDENHSWHLGVAMNGNEPLDDSEYTTTGNPLPRYESIMTKRMAPAADNAKAPSTKSHSAAEDVYSSSNHRSFSLGATVSYDLTERLALQSGVVFTSLTSDLMLCNKQQAPQKVTYLGIPLQINVSLFQSGRWRLYASGGGMYDLPLRCTRDGKRLSYKTQQWSLSTAAGAQWLITKHFGLYVEPHLAYYLDNGKGSDVPTLFTEHPLCFNLQAGLQIRL